jgi:predicted enzyme related to lactoylglutathione lyase
MITRIHSVFIWTQNVGRLVPFYRDVLGLKPEMETEGFVVFRLDGAQLAIGAHSKVQGRSLDPNRVMVNFQVEDCQGEFERLREQGVDFVRTPEKEEGIIIATFLDPDGNTLQLFQEA